jgi:DNA-binding NarL/FixJ family response regulator
MHADATYAHHAFRAGARGYITKSSPPDVLVAAIHAVCQGRTALCDEINQLIAESRLLDDISPIEALTPREFEILRMILDAKSTLDTAAAFNLSPKTIANHHYAIKSKLGVQSDIELVYLCMKHGLVPSLVPPRSV